MKIKPLILCGGTGSRLWPASRKNFPKQFIPLFKGKSLLELTIERVQNFRNFSAPLIIGSQSHNFFINDILKKLILKLICYLSLSQKIQVLQFIYLHYTQMKMI